MPNSTAREQQPVILIVDDESSIAALMQQLLQIRGYLCHTASNAEDAAAIIRNSPPDLIMLDALLPGRSGLQFCRELKSNPLTELIPVIIITTSPDASRAEGISAGADDFLCKPVLAEELIAVIKTQVRRKRAVDHRLLSAQQSRLDREFDAFISHASEDKQGFVRPPAQHLTALGVRIWYDEHVLQVGDSLREGIERGLAHSSYGIVVLSPNFFAKRWPQRELNGLAARENDGRKVILPVWFNLDFKDVQQMAPMLADRIAARSQDGIAAVVQRLMRVIRPDLSLQSTAGGPSYP